MHHSPESTQIDPLVQLWVLRILIRLGGHRKFIQKDGFYDDELAFALGLDVPDLDEVSRFDASRVRDQLHRLYRKAESNSEHLVVPEVLHANLEEISRLLNLTISERLVLALIVLLKMDDSLRSAAELLGFVSTTGFETASARILGIEQRMVSAALREDGTLEQVGFVRMDRRGRFHMSGKVDLSFTRFADLIVSRRAKPVELLSDVLVRAPLPELGLQDFPHLERELEVLKPLLAAAVVPSNPGANIFVHGPPGTGKTQLVRLLAHSLGVELFEVATEVRYRDPLGAEARLCSYRAAHALLRYQKAIILFDEVEDVFSNGPFGQKGAGNARKGWMNRTIENSSVPTFWLSNDVRCVDRAVLRRFDMVIEVPIPPKQQRFKIVKQSCGDLVDDGYLQKIARSENTSPGLVARSSAVVRRVSAHLQTQSPGEAIIGLLNHTLSAQGHRKLALSDATALPAAYSLEYLNPDSDLTPILDGLRSSKQGRLCLYGPPGTGKTAFAHWLADQLQVPLLTKCVSDLLSPYIGMTERNISMAFHEASRDGCLLLIDEVDSFLQDRRQAQRSWEVTEVNEMLTNMEAFSGIFVASTNLVDGLDQAALRRFDAKIRFRYMHANQTLGLLKAYCETMGLPPPDALVARQLSTLDNLAPGDFAALARQHRFRPIASAEEFVRLLQAECAFKGNSRRPIGFVH